MEAVGLWADLPVHLLIRIFYHLQSFADRACCFGVCSRWQSAAMLQPCGRPFPRTLKLPLLLRPSTAGVSVLSLFFGTAASKPTVRNDVRSARFLSSFPEGRFIVARGQWRGYALLDKGKVTRLPDGLLGNDDEIPLDLGVGTRHSAVIILAATLSPLLASMGRQVVPAIALGHHKAVWCCPGMDRWIPMDPQRTRAGSSSLSERINLEEFEDVIHYRCDEREGFYFLTSRERLVVYDVLGRKEAIGPIVFYDFPGHRMTSPPEPSQNVAGRYLVESGRTLLMVKRFTSPGHGTVSFQVFRLRWKKSQPYWQQQQTTTLIGTLLFISRGCSRAFDTGRSMPGYIYFLDDVQGFRDPWSIVRTEKRYRCSDAGWFNCFTQHVEKSWRQGPPPDCSPWIWLFH